MSAITDRLGIGDEIRELKLGRTLTSRDRDPNNSFHTLRYDFKPASVDREKPAILEVEANSKVTVTAPNTESSGSCETVFKGSRKAHQKECVLIIDHKTGEITLEKLNQNITVKRTRQQNTGKGQKQLSVRPNTPVPSRESSAESKKLVPQMPNWQQKPNSPLMTTNRQNSPNNTNHNKQRLSPNKANSNTSLSQTHRNSPSMSQPISPSMPTLSSLSSMSAPMKPSVPAVASTQSFAQNNKSRDINGALGLSDSSSDSSDHESSSSSSDTTSDSSSDDDDPQHTHHPPNNPNITGITGLTSATLSTVTTSANNSTKSKPNLKSNPNTSSSDSDSDNDDNDNQPFNSRHNSNSSNHNGINGSHGSAPVLPSMPKFSQLSEDLRLSESGSDSED